MPRALLSVSDKTGLEPFAQALAQLGFELLSTGGTYKAVIRRRACVSAALPTKPAFLKS